MPTTADSPAGAPTADVCVLGGGLAGLAAATHAARAGAAVVLLERSAALGGRARSTTTDGFTRNLGAHALYRGGAAEAGLAELGVAVTGGTPAGGYGEHDGALVTLPQEPLQLLRASWLGLRGRIGVARVLAGLARPPSPQLDTVSWGDHVRRRTSDPRARALLLAVGRLATYAAEDGIAARAVLTSLRAATDPGVRYLDGGWQTLVDGLAAAATAAGVRIVTGAGSIEVGGSAGGWRVASAAQDVRAGGLVVAVGPPARAAAVLAGVLPNSLCTRLAERPPVRAAVLDVALRRLPRPDRSFVLGLDAPTYLSVHSRVASLAPANGAVLHLVRYLHRDEQADDGTRASLEGLLDRTQPRWRNELVDARFLPDMTVVGDLAAAAGGGIAGRQPVALAPGLWVAGDWVGDEGLLTDAVFASARRAGHEAALAATSLGRVAA